MYSDSSSAAIDLLYHFSPDLAVNIESRMTPVNNLSESSQIGFHIPEEMAQNNGKVGCKKLCVPDDVGGSPCSWQGQ